MNEIVNLKRFRKKVEREENERIAQQNRLLHGRTKAEKALSKAQSDAARRHIEAHRMNSGDDA
ncbi:MAG: DUF4169 family protein [Rhizobiales bacterium]|nr:DUF4169 family protein [Hyphomicrobiales bacterium]